MVLSSVVVVVAARVKVLCVACDGEAVRDKVASCGWWCCVVVLQREWWL